MDTDVLSMLIVGIGFILILTYFTSSSVIEHEKAHQQIAIHFGCINGTISHSILGSSSFICHEYIERTEEQVNYEYILHEENEIVNYNLSSLGQSIILCFALLSLIIIFVNIRKKEQTSLK